MALKGNNGIFLKSPLIRYTGAELAIVRSNFNTPGASRNITAGEGMNNDLVAITSGSRPPYSWVIPTKPGALSSFNQIIGTGNLTASGAMGITTTSLMEGTSTFTALGELIANMVSSISGTSTFTANASVVINALATLSGTSTFTADIGALAFLDVTMTGTSTFTAGSSGPGTMSAFISNAAVLSPEALSVAVWDYLKTNPTTPGTMKDELQKTRLAAENSFAVSS
jgi:hypothetical protein